MQIKFLLFLFFSFFAINPNLGLAQQSTLILDDNSKYQILGANIYYGSPANILVIRCQKGCERLIPAWNSDRRFERGILSYNRETLNLEEIEIFHIQTVNKKVEIVFHINQINYNF